MPVGFTAGAATAATRRDDRRWSWLAVTAFGLVCVVAISVLTGRLIAATTSFDYEGQTLELVQVLGFVGLFTIVPVAVAIVLAHLAVGDLRRRDRRGILLAGMALGAGYLLAFWYLNRLIAATIATAGYGDFAEFLPNVFYWA